MSQHLVLVGFNEAVSNKRHEAGDVADLDHVPDVSALIANRTVILVEYIDETPQDVPIVESEGN